MKKYLTYNYNSAIIFIASKTQKMSLSCTRAMLPHSSFLLYNKTEFLNIK